MDSYFSSNSRECFAHNYIRENIWHESDISIDTIGQCAAFAAVERLLKEDLYVVPQTMSELETLL